MALSDALLDAAPVRRARLDNGLTLIVQEVHTAPLVSVWCWYRVGSRDEAPGLTGASHWVEHMNFKGTTHIPSEQMKGIVERFGGMWNGYTWIDQTTYLETAGRAALDQMLFIEAERMASGLYEPEECESERTVIISELQGGENDPDQLLDTEVTATAFRAHPYGHPTIGWLSDLEAMTRDDLYGHYRRFYIPNNATLVVVGDVNTDDVLRRAEHHFGQIRTGAEPARIAVKEPPQFGERRVVVEREGTTGYVKLTYHAPSALEPDFFPLLRARRGAVWSEGGEPLVELQRRAATEEGSALHRDRRARARIRRVGGAAADRGAVPLHAVVHGDGGSALLRTSKGRQSTRSNAFAPRGWTRRSSCAPNASSAHASCSRTTA